MTVNLSDNKIKIPEPNVTNGLFGITKPKTNSKQKRTYNRPYVGIIKLPEISKTPLYDSYLKNRKENPKTKYVLSNPTSKNALLIKGIISIAIIIGGLITLFKK